MEKNLTLIALFAALTTVLFVMPAVTLPIGVPISGTSLGVMLCGTVLGARRGALAALPFVVLVALGLPLLVGVPSGLGLFVGPRAGFLIGFPVAALVTGLVVERWRTSVPVAAFAGAALGCMVVLYAFGIPGMALALDKTLPEAALLMTPFLAGDLVKCVLAAVITRAVAQMRPGALLSRA
jgi:biotin transport system substrate-specific component